MWDPVRRFEVAILRPAQLLILAAGTVTALRGRWWWVVGCVLGLLYLGVVGSKLHPLQTASDLAQGPLEGPVAAAESAVLTQDDKRRLVDQACTRIGILAGAVLFFVLFGLFRWRWYWAVPAAWVAVMLSGAVLKLVFRTVASPTP